MRMGGINLSDVPRKQALGSFASTILYLVIAFAYLRFWAATSAVQSMGTAFAIVAIAVAAKQWWYADNDAERETSWYALLVNIGFLVGIRIIIKVDITDLAIYPALLFFWYLSGKTLARAAVARADNSRSTLFLDALCSGALYYFIPNHLLPSMIWPGLAILMSIAIFTRSLHYRAQKISANAPSPASPASLT